MGHIVHAEGKVQASLLGGGDHQRHRGRAPLVALARALLPFKRETEGVEEGQLAATLIPAREREDLLYYIVDTEKPFEQAARDLAAAVTRHGFGVLHIHDLGATLRSKGIDFVEQCQIFEVCNPGQAAKVLATDMRLNMALPCRISLFTEGPKTRIGLIRPADMLATLSKDEALRQTAQEVEDKTIQMIDEAR